MPSVKRPEDVSATIQRARLHLANLVHAERRVHSSQPMSGNGKTLDRRQPLLCWNDTNIVGVLDPSRLQDFQQFRLFGGKVLGLARILINVE